ncbi:MAG: histidine phosphatase family protein [Burkholderiaceae bacterium]|nr:histidine phosphatase family protein [Burkholderiaceae bacterium]
MNPACTLILIRHGETLWNREGRIQGHTDTDLAPEGRNQAGRVARYLARDGGSGAVIAAVVASDLKRTRQTAEPIAQALRLDLSLEPGLRERDFGEFQGLTHAQIEVRDPDGYARLSARDPGFAPRGGESLEGLRARVMASIDRICERYAGSTCVVVTHGGVLDIIRRRATGMELSAKRDFVLPNAALNIVTCGPTGWRVRVWGKALGNGRSLDEL